MRSLDNLECDLQTNEDVCPANRIPLLPIALQGREPVVLPATITQLLSTFWHFPKLLSRGASVSPMFKLRSIAARLILAISLTVAVACGILGTFSIIQQRSLTRLALDQQLKLQYDSVIAALDYEGRAALAVSAVIATLPPVAEAIAKGDRDALMALLDGPMKALKSQGMPLISFHTPPATAFFRVHEPKIFGEDISARRKTVVESNKTGKPIVGVEPGRDSLGIFAMTPIMRDGKNLGVADIGVSFGKEFVDSTKRRFGVDLAVYRVDGKSFTTIASTLGDGSAATQDELKIAFDGGTLRRDATLNGHPAALSL